MKSKLNNKIKVPLLILGALLVLIALISGGVYARYLSQRGNVDGTASSQNFYFESDYLKAEGATYAVNPSVSGTVIPFTLMNYADEYRVSDFDVNYTVTVEASGGNAPTVENGSGTLATGSKNRAAVTLSALTPGTTYTVTAVGSAGENGFKQTLSATFVVGSLKEQAYMNVKDEGEYVTLTVWTEKLTGEVTITLDAASELLPDNTDPRMSEWKSSVNTYTDNEFTQEYSSYKYRFFKSDLSKTYTNDFFEVTVGEKKAEPGTP